MNSQEEDQYLMYAVDSCSADVVSANPYWSMSDSQRAEWKKYARCRLEQEQEQEHDEQRSESDDNEEELEAEEQNQHSTIEQDQNEHTDEQDQPTVVKEDKKKLWVTYQQWARSALREETGKEKIPLKTVNARARIAWIEDGWGSEK